MRNHPTIRLDCVVQVELRKEDPSGSFPRRKEGPTNERFFNHGKQTTKVGTARSLPLLLPRMKKAESEPRLELHTGGGTSIPQ